jgi:hypothetical protein
MTPKSRIAVGAATLAVAAGGISPALASATTHWSNAKCEAYAKKYDKAKGMIMSDANKELKKYGCKQRVK